MRRKNSALNLYVRYPVSTHGYWKCGKQDWGAECYPPQPIAIMNTAAKQSGHAVYYIINSRTGQMVQWVKLIASESDDLSLVSGTHLMERGN